MLNAEFLEDEVQLLVQGLDLLLASKREAFRQVARRDSDGGRLAGICGTRFWHSADHRPAGQN